MEDLELEASWERPDEPGAMVRGRLSCSRRGVRVTSDEPMVAGKRDGNTSSYTLGTMSWPVVHGVADDGRQISLIDVEGQYAPLGAHTTRAQVALVGYRPIVGDSFVEVRMSFDWLTAWLQPPSIYDRGEHDDDPRMTVDLAEEPIATVQLDDATVSFVAGTAWNLSRDQIHVTRTTWISVATPRPCSWRELLDEHVRPLQDFLVVALGRPVQLTSLVVQAAESAVAEPEYDDHLSGPWLFDVKLPLIQRDPHESPDIGALNAYPSTVLLPTAQFLGDVDRIVRGWYDVNRRDRIAVIRLNAQAYSTFNYLTNQSAAVAQAFESLFLAECEKKQKSKTEHEERVRKVNDALATAGLSDDIVTWATAVVRARNDKSFPERFADVIALSAELGTYLTEAVPDLANQLTGLRHSVSHGSASGDRPTARDPAIERMFYLKELGTWIMRTALLELAGARVATTAAANPNVVHAVTKLTKDSRTKDEAT